MPKVKLKRKIIFSSIEFLLLSHVLKRRNTNFRHLQLVSCMRYKKPNFSSLNDASSFVSGMERA